MSDILMDIVAQKDFTVTKEDRVALATMLIKFGYRVQIVKEKDRNGKVTIIVRAEE